MVRGAPCPTFPAGGARNLTRCPRASGARWPERSVQHGVVRRRWIRADVDSLQRVVDKARVWMNWLTGTNWQF